ncbi:MAG: DNA mismatch repair endonuclease MutL [Butyrivibrio sp.]|nr:DNA mismatch repair endonuclease MutL [Muribaculum sp.]MCM1551623.1 DNA mismatch repair endonuclease MutL [Butyrivibrio sp.]
MAQIHVLDSETIDKIAAGEVVERPSSVVKELVENAIDAGASAVTVEIKDGGIEFIRVTDNGSGMAGDQIRQAFLRHATSKIEHAEDLIRVSSLGFRGEALSSIAAVAKVEVITKTADSLTGNRIVLEGAVEKEFAEVGAPDGTTFVVRNLFFNTPVRRKFLKLPATEGGYIADLMEHLALSRPDISFKFQMGSQVRFHTSGSGDLKEVIYRIYGRDVAASLVPIQLEQNGNRVEGYLGKPVLVRSNRNFEIYFINRRFIKSNVIARAIEEGYREYLMQHKFPLCVLHITMDVGQVDVNVHPTKMDVRFSDGITFSKMLSGAVHDTLKNHEMIPDVTLGDEKAKQREERQERIERQKLPTPEPFERNRGSAYRVMEETDYQTEAPKLYKNEKTQDFMQNPVWERVKSTENADEAQEFAGKVSKLRADYGKAEMAAEVTAAGLIALNAARETDKASELKEETFFQEESSTKMPLSDMQQDGRQRDNAQTDIAQPSMKQEEAARAGLAQETKQMNLFEEKLLSVENRSRYHIIGQVFDTYWMVQFEDKLFIIDQHAAHEKVKYERLMRQLREKSVVSQALMPPVIVSLSAQEELLLKEYMETFVQLGFEIEAFGGNEYALRSVPVDLYGCSEREMFLEVLDELDSGVSRGSFQVIEEKIASMSCKAAVKGNNRLSHAEAQRLIDELLTLENPYNCPHGRPTIITMTKYEMEKKFKRIV